MVRRVSPAIIALAIASCLALGAGPASADHVGCGDTITTDTKLHKDLVNCPNNGIVIGANNITLDLNGHRIDGDGEFVDSCPDDEFCDVGVANDAHNGVTIKGGKLREFEVGVFVFGARDNHVRHLCASANSFAGVILSESPDSRVAKNSANRNGLTTEGSGIMLFGSDDVRIERNSVSGNGDNGIFVGFDSDDNLIARNRSSGAPFAALVIEGNRNHVVRNRSRNPGDIIVVGNRNVITRNHVADALGCGEGECGVGISFEGGHDNLIARNFVSRATVAGIRVRAFEPDTPPAIDNVVRRNHVRHAHDGFLVEFASDTVLESNHAVRSKDDGFDVNSRATTLTRNHAVHNGDLGIEAVFGVVDGGGNKAHGNGDPRQCTNVACN
jgi:parallel beta-helix repeat protein